MPLKDFHENAHNNQNIFSYQSVTVFRKGLIIISDTKVTLFFVICKRFTLFDFIVLCRAFLTLIGNRGRTHFAGGGQSYITQGLVRKPTSSSASGLYNQGLRENEILERIFEEIPPKTFLKVSKEDLSNKPSPSLPS